MNILIGTDYLEALYRSLVEAMPKHTVYRCDETKVAENIAEAVVYIPARGPIGEAAMARAPKLRLIQQFGVGVDMVDIPSARRRGIAVANAPGHATGAGDVVAELALFLLIGIGRDLPVLQQLIRERSGAIPMGWSLFDKTVCIVGMGNTGRALAKMLRAFRCRIIGVKRTVSAGLREELGVDELVASDKLLEVLPQCDFLVLAVPLTDQTRGLLGKKAIEALKPGAFVVNVCRGPVIDREPFLVALKSGKIRGAGLDVFWIEPPDPSDELFSYPVVATPHAASMTDLFVNSTAALIAENVARLERGDPILYRVDQ